MITSFIIQYFWLKRTTEVVILEIIWREILAAIWRLYGQHNEPMTLTEAEKRPDRSPDRGKNRSRLWFCFSDLVRQPPPFD
jgi:hypothetical protein